MSTATIVQIDDPTIVETVARIPLFVRDPGCYPQHRWREVTPNVLDRLWRVARWHNANKNFAERLMRACFEAAWRARQRVDGLATVGELTMSEAEWRAQGHIFSLMHAQAESHEKHTINLHGACVERTMHAKVPVFVRMA